MVEAAGHGQEKGWLYHPPFPDYWERAPLYSLADWVNGLAFRKIQFSESGMPIIKIAEIKGGISEQTKYTEQTFDDSVRVRFGDLLFSWSGQPETSIDAYWWDGPEGWLNQHIFRVTPAPHLDPTFFYYLLKYLNPNFVGIARNKQTTGLGHVTKGDLKNLEVAYPDLPEQQAITDILGALDDKIDLNHRRHEALERMARALFNSWFVTFEPVRAKMNGLWHPGESRPGLTAELYDLFPDCLVDSAIGKVPEGWEVAALGEHVSADRGLSYKGKHLSDQGVPMHNLNSILEGGGYKYEGIKYYTGEFKDRHRVNPGDLLVANTEQGHNRLLIGYAALVPARMGDRGIFSHHLYHVKPATDSPLTKVFLAYLLNSGPMQEVVSGYANGTTVNMLPPDALELPEFVKPPRELVDRFTTVVQSIVVRQEEFVSESESLAELRDILLPRLISGELRAPGAEQIVEEARNA